MTAPTASRSRPHPLRIARSVALLLLGGASLASAGTRPADRLPPERVSDPPGIAAPADGAPQASSVITFGRFTHRQVNVALNGANIVGDAANEPSIAVDQTFHARMVIGWRQFDNVTSNFRQAGYGFTSDGGLTWTARKIEPGVFRSDPVLGVDAAGKFLYSSLTSDANGNLSAQMFSSTNGGSTWGPAVTAYGGDKQWITVDRTGGPGQNFVHQAWSVAGNPYYPSTYNRSLNGGASFTFPSLITAQPIWGTLDLDANDSLYVAGMDPDSGYVLVARSADAWKTAAAPSFATVVANPMGYVRLGGPNPVGLLGQIWVGVDRSNGPRRGWIYVLATLETANDPVDVLFSRSTDGGKTWSAPVRVNDDPVAGHAWQWFGTMSVSPDGRIDAVWNDSRLTGDSTRTALFYSCSYDGGFHWSPNEQASPVWNSMVGFPNQQKIGDYYHMVSDATGADLAWAATFNNEQDVWYCRITPPVLSVEDGGTRPVRLSPATPNPFTTSTAIRYEVPSSGAHVTLDVYDASGRRVTTLVDGHLAGGPRTATWSGRDEAGRMAGSGLYFCRYRAGSVTETRKIMIMR